jgi:hypothetical protein
VTSEALPGQSGDDGRNSGEFGRCTRCSMRLRRSEMDIHLAHAHDIGPSTGKKERSKDSRGRGRPRRSEDD